MLRRGKGLPPLAPQPPSSRVAAYLCFAPDAHPGMPSGIPPELAFSFAGIPTFSAGMILAPLCKDDVWLGQWEAIDCEQESGQALVTGWSEVITI